MITVAKLKTRTVRDLAAMAKKKKVPGWHAMRKDELIKALVKHAKTLAAKRAKATAGNTKKAAAKPHNGEAAGVAKPTKVSQTDRKKGPSPYARRRLKEIKAKLAQSKNLAFKAVTEGNGHLKDRLVAMVRDAYWLHAYWELTKASTDRAKAAMGQYWHGARPVLRLYELSRTGTTNTSRRVVRDIQIHGGVNNWYVDVQDPPKSYQLDIGYLAAGDKFYSLVRSNVVTTPRPGTSESFDKNWPDVAKDFDRVYAMSGGYTEQDADSDLKDVLEQRLQRPMGDPMTTRFGLGAAGMGQQLSAFKFQVDTELIVHGVTEPDAHITLRGEPVSVRSDGSFAIRFTLPNRRHVLPVVASSGDGVEQHTIVLAVDRNTKVMEPVIRSPGE